MLYRDYLKSKYQNTAVKLANAEGVPCVLEYSKGKNLRNYEVCGNSVQDGVPTPESPVEIQSGGDLTVKNLLDYTTVSARSGMTVAFIDNGFVYTGNYHFTFDGSFLEIGSTYVMSWNFEGDDTLTPTWRLQYEDGTYSYTIQNGASLTIAQSVSKILVYPEMSKTTYTTTFTNIQLELGSTVTEYEPYHKYDIPITVTGKNLFDKSISTNANIKNETTITNTAYSLPVLKTNAICNILKPNTTYTISCEFECTAIPSEDEYTYSDGILGFMIYTSVSGYSSKTVYITKQMAVGEIYQFSITFTTPEIFDTGGNYGFLIYRNKYTGKSTIAASMICRNIQIEEASSATAYEPYKGSETTHIYLDEPLRKVGDYSDYIDFKNQKVVRKVKHREFSSNNNWSVYSSAAHHFQIIVGDNYFAQVEGVKVMSNYYPQYSGKYHSITSLDYAVLSADGSRLRFRDIRYTTLDEWKTFLDTLETPLAVNYILATPTEENISLPALKTFKGTNVMSVDTAVLPSNIKAKYIRT